MLLEESMGGPDAYADGRSYGCVLGAYTCVGSKNVTSVCWVSYI